jgi:hypothetical protein
VSTSIGPFTYMKNRIWILTRLEGSRNLEFRNTEVPEIFSYICQIISRYPQLFLAVLCRVSNASSLYKYQYTIKINHCSANKLHTVISISNNPWQPKYSSELSWNVHMVVRMDPINYFLGNSFRLIQSEQ